MSFSDDHRKAAAEKLEIFLLQPPFSFFDFVEDRFGDYESIRRIFSLARSSRAETLVLETILACGIVAEENEDLLRLLPDYRNAELLRLSFWKRAIDENELSTLTSDDLAGYALFKNDQSVSANLMQWHVFEAVFGKYPHSHNCVPRPCLYQIAVAGMPFAIHGLLYCQQNGLNKACAQVALRSLLSRNLPEGDISYRRINELAATVSPGFNPSSGLNVLQIRSILSQLGFEYRDIDYSQQDEAVRGDLPYQKYVYAGLESGAGALVGFRLAGRDLRVEAKHIIPVYGHTFNKDTWAPNAEVAYFRIGEGVGYVPSESWTSSFLGHDDNFGPNFCIPRLYIDRDKVDYVIEIFRPGIRYSGILAEAISLNILYSLLPSLDGAANRWIERLLDWTNKQQVVFRAQAMTTNEYVSHLESLRDWEGLEENREFCALLRRELPAHVWAVEISTPQLFPANERKLGEIVLDATKALKSFSPGDVFVFARLPGRYLFGGDISNGAPRFTQIPSVLQSHTDLIRL